MFVDRYRRAALGGLAAVAIAVMGPAAFAQSAPPTPTGLASAVQGSTVTLAWSPGAGTTTPIVYQIEVGSGPGASDLVVSVVQSPGVVAANVRNGLYFVRVRAANAAGVSAPSNEIAVRVGCVTAPTVPVGLVTQISGTSVAVAWQPSPGATGYVLEAGSAPGAANLAMVPLGAPSLLASAPPGTYYVRVRARNACGSSAPSGEAVLNVGGAGPAPAPTPVPTPGPTPAPTPTSNTVTIANATMNPSSIGVGQTSTLHWTTSNGGDPRTITIAPGIGRVPANARSWPVTPTGTTLYQITFNQADGSFPNDVTSFRHVTVTVTGAATPPPPTEPPAPPPPPPPEPTGSIFGTVDPVILGTCSSAVHDGWSVDGGDGYRYRTWHPQVDPSGCVYAHEHGDNPALSGNAEIRAVPPKFGYIGRRHPMPDEPNGHDEPHEGFKVFIANPGDQNDEGRVNRVYSRSVFHMGTGGPKRFTMQHHSAEIRLIHPEFGLKAFTQLMMDTGGSANVCDPRAATPTKDVVQLNSPCPLTSAYEIWGTTQAVMFQGREIYRSFATPAVFDPITVRNPNNPSELVYAWDPRMASSKVYNTDWSWFRGCQRESYAQPGHWQNHVGGRTIYYTNPMGQEVPATDPSALEQQISTTQSVGAPATNDGMFQFKMTRNYCQQLTRLGLKN